MNNPGVKLLGDFQVGAAATQQGDVITDLEGMTACALSVKFGYGAGGSTSIVVVETSLNQAGSWIEIARFDFATAGAEKVINLSALTPKTSPYTAVALSAEGSVDGILGDRLRARVTSTGTYSGSTTASVRANVR